MKGTRGLAEKTRDNSLYLSVCAQFNVQEAQMVKEWFRTKLSIVSAADPNVCKQFTAMEFNSNAEMKEFIRRFISVVDLGVKDVSMRETVIGEDDFVQIKKHFSNLPEKDNIRMQEFFATHDLYENKQIVGTRELSFTRESDGTRMVFAMTGPWFYTIRNGGTLLVDEFGSSLHTQLALKLVKLFQNKRNQFAQLIVATHDTNLLRKEVLRRDQIWFAEKDKYGSTDLYGLVEYKINQPVSARDDASFAKDYLLGKYGAIPYFGNVDQFLKDFIYHGEK